MINDALLICYLRPARRKARQVATLEALSLLRDLHAAAPPGGPASEQGGLFWAALPEHALAAAIARLPRLGYTSTVDWLEPLAQPDARHALSPHQRLVRWHGRLHRLVRVYAENAQEMRERAPDRRTFLLETAAGDVRPVQGYRADGGQLSRRGLPVYDAKLLVNLVAAGEHTLFLDPFAGIGGLVIEALASGYTVTSADCDPALRHGLAQLGAQHVVTDARALPFAAETFDAIATEPPFHEAARDTVIAALHEMERVLKRGGRLAILCAAAQADALRGAAELPGLKPFLDAPINRKGLPVVVLAWQKD